ncbi:MAG: response regulator [Candidatus Hydrogenedentota bacterium]
MRVVYAEAELKEASFMDQKQSFSTSDVAKYCHVTADTIRKWAEAGRINVFKTPGGHRRIRREELIAFLRENGIPLHSDLSHDGVKILIVDNDKTIIAVIKRFLEHAPTNFEISVASDGFEAGHQIGAFSPKVVFLDIRLSGIDGFEVCRRIKNSPDTVDTHVIAMTAFHEEEVVAEMQGVGAATCLKKPFTPDSLRRALAMVGIETG